MSDQWILFGFDLTRISDYVRLAVHQLLWGHEAGVRRRFCPSITTLVQPETDKREFAEFGLVERPITSGENLALIIPSDIILHKVLHLPAASELELASAMGYEAISNSPFPDDDTVFGWQIISRQGGFIEVSLAITSRAAVTYYLSSLEASSIPSNASLEIWSCDDGRLTQIRGFAEGNRRKAYMRALSHRVLRAAAFTLGIILLTSLPTMIIQLRASQLDDLAEVAQVTAGAATEAKSRLVEVEGRLTDASQFFERRIYYHEWLETLAQLTPDSVYLTRLAMDGGRLTISGFADNAAEYQTLLADTDLVSDLSAPSAFTRDGRAGKERFTLTMRIDGGDK